MDLLMESQPDNPLNQNLILKMVLKHVGKAGIVDLKNCRLVSRFWNKVAVQVLEQLGFVLQLDHDKMLLFKSVLWSTQMSRTLEDDHNHDELESLRISLKLFPSRRYGHLSDTSEAAQLLFHYSRLRVAFINCLCNTVDAGRAGYDIETLLNEQGNLELFNLFKLASRHLTNLKIRWGELDPRHCGQFDFNCYSSLTFPRLASLSFKILGYSNGDAGNEQIDLTKHVIGIVNNAPKLMKLVLKVSDGGSEERAAESVRTILQSCSKSLKELEIEPAEFGDSLKLLLEIKLPKLTTLRLSRFRSGYISAELNQFLVKNCPSLVELEVKLEILDVLQLEQELGIEFPVIPNIPRLSLYSFYFAILTCQLTSLNFMSANLALFFLLGDYLKRSSGQLHPPPMPPNHGDYLVLTNITALQVHISYYNNEMFDLLDFARAMYQYTFPNVKELCIIPKYKLGSVSSDIEMTRVIKFLCNHPGIETLEIRKYGEPWLERIPQTNLNLQGVKVLKLLPTKGGGCPGVNLPGLLARCPALEYIFGKCVNCPGVNLPALLARFPALEYIQFGKQVATGAKLRAFHDMIKRFANYNF